MARGCCQREGTHPPTIAHAPSLLQAIFIFVNNTLPPTAALMSTVYEQHRDEDGFMYMMYSGENTFGGLEELLEPLDE